MNRRSLLSLIGLAPIIGLFVRETAAASAPPQSVAEPVFTKISDLNRGDLVIVHVRGQEPRLMEFLHSSGGLVHLSHGPGRNDYIVMNANSLFFIGVERYPGRLPA